MVAAIVDSDILCLLIWQEIGNTPCVSAHISLGCDFLIWNNKEHPSKYQYKVLADLPYLTDGKSIFFWGYLNFGSLWQTDGER